MNVLDAHPEKPLAYVSEQIVERRRRMLREARRMLAQDGWSGFSVRKLCQRAGIAQRTLYNAYDSKDRVVALANKEAFDNFEGYVRYKTERNTLEGLLNRTVAVNERNLKLRAYAEAMTAIYFGSGTPPDVWQTIHEMGASRWRSFLDDQEQRGCIRAEINLRHFSSNIANLQFAVINDWVNGRVDDDQFIFRLIESMLVALAGVATGGLAGEVEGFLREISATGKPPSFPVAVWSPPREHATSAEDQAEPAKPADRRRRSAAATKA